MIVERNTIQREDNSALYFIVGALLVAVAAFAIYYFATGTSSAPSDTAADTTRVESVAPASGSANTTSTSVNGNTVSTTTTQQ